MRVLIIEDETLLAEELAETLTSLDKKITILNILTSIESAITWFSKNSCDLLFLDIHLNDGLSFSIFERVKVTCPVVFTTAYDKYAIKAFDVNSIAYLLKPYEESDLKKVLEKYELLQRQKHNNIEDLLKFIKKDKTEYLKRITLTIGKLQKPTKVNDIAYFMAEDRCVFAITKEKRKYLYDFPLYELEQKLNPKDFFRVNRKFIINIESIEGIITYSKGRALLKLKPKAEQDIIVSSEKAKEMKEWLHQ